MEIELNMVEKDVSEVYLMSLYDIIEECNCVQNTYIEEVYDKKKRKFNNIRHVKIFGSDTMVSWLLLRMYRYMHHIDQLNDNKSVLGTYEIEE